MNRAYPQAVVTTENHSLLKKGQIVEVIQEDGVYYIVQTGKTGLMQKIEKKDISFN